ncbi:MAG: hypothetical protein PUP92_14550 [Rhizonema sp. PD38]|nr:hypothetical protein [Rhizonema sp. PD38]
MEVESAEESLSSCESSCAGIGSNSKQQSILKSSSFLLLDIQNDLPQIHAKSD